MLNSHFVRTNPLLPLKDFCEKLGRDLPVRTPVTFFFGISNKIVVEVWARDLTVAEAAPIR
jgi:hypothetical protein